MGLTFVTATRESVENFQANSLLCKSLFVISGITRVNLRVTGNNVAPLSAIYNQAIDTADAQDTLVFIHDDVYIDDWLIEKRLEEGLAAFDVIGVAGNTRREPRQANWFLQPISEGSACQDPMRGLSGQIHHQKSADATKASAYGPAPLPILLLDGVFIAARAGTLQQAKVRFDPQFAFHFYDTDFSRRCEQAGLKLGTWPIALTHQSAGCWQTNQWNDAYEAYLRKWGD